MTLLRDRKNGKGKCQSCQNYGAISALEQDVLGRACACESVFYSAKFWGTRSQYKESQTERVMEGPLTLPYCQQQDFPDSGPLHKLVT